jgi:secondary thiamine-phosphate synthase enzyme
MIMIWIQQAIELKLYRRGFHVITQEVVSRLDLGTIKTGLCHIFIQHTSASLTLNENVSPDVRRDFEQYVRRAVPDDGSYFEHRLEGPDVCPPTSKRHCLVVHSAFRFVVDAWHLVHGRAFIYANTAKTVDDGRLS